MLGIISSTANNPLQGKTFVIDAGHGGTDSGAVSSNGIREKDLTLDIARYMYDEFRKKGLVTSYNILKEDKVKGNSEE